MLCNARLLVGGFDERYMERLALYVKNYFGEKIDVIIDAGGCAGKESRGALKAGEYAGTPRPGKGVVLGSADYVKSVMPAKGIVLIERNYVPERKAPEETPYKYIYRYMPAREICRELSRALDAFGYGAKSVTAGTEPEWIALTGDGPAWELEAFGLTCACILGEKNRVLYADFVPFGGTGEMTGAGIREDMADLVMALRGGGGVSLSGYTLEMDGFKAIPGMCNPSNFYEFSTEDAGLLRKCIASENAFDTVVIAVGAVSPGTEELLAKATRCIHITGRGSGRQFSRNEWKRVLGMIRKENPREAEVHEAPVFDQGVPGTHVMKQWADGAPGETIREMLLG